MITEDKLLEVLEKESLYAFKADVDLDYKKFILLQSESVDELIKFAKVNNINSIFYDYIYYNKDSYKFDLEEVELYTDESIFKLIKKDLVAHNKKIDKIDFSKPRLVVIYTIYQGEKIGLMLIDSWIEELEDEILETDEQLEVFMEKHEDILFEKRQKEQAKLDKLKIEFEEFLLNDEEFLCCTNQAMRRHYMKIMLDSNKAKKYMKAFRTVNMIGNEVEDRTSLWMCIESVWRKYKIIEKEQKQR